MFRFFAKRCLTGIVLSAFFFLLSFYAPVWIISSILCVMLLLILITEWPRLLAHQQWYWWLLTPIYPVMPFILALMLNHDPLHRPLLVLLVITVAAYDTGAYLTGNLIGRHKLAPRISPGKTWEGLGGGIIMATGALWILTHVWWQMSVTWFYLSVVAVLLSCIAMLGDLFESWLKRRAGVKDSGSLLPGHGGLLDRCDGMMSGMVVIFIMYLAHKKSG